MQHHGVLLVMISEVDVHFLVEEHVERVHREGVLEVREVVVRVEGHGQEADPPGCDGQQVGACELQVHIEVVEQVVVRLDEGIVFELLDVLLLLQTQRVVRLATGGARAAGLVGPVVGCASLVMNPNTSG
jgi:hypothetical protein